MSELEGMARLEAISSRHLGKMPNCAGDVRSDIAFLLTMIREHDHRASERAYRRELIDSGHSVEQVRVIMGDSR